MVIILLILLPIIDVVQLAENLKLYIACVKKSSLITCVSIYAITVACYGIIVPTWTLTRYKYSLRSNESPRDTLIRVIRTSNANRDYLLGSLSLFLTLVAWRLLEYIQFSAKLHEFSDLMANYDLIDSNYKEDETFIIDEEKYDVDSVSWLPCINLNLQVHEKLAKYLEDERASPNKTSKTSIKIK